MAKLCGQCGRSVSNCICETRDFSLEKFKYRLGIGIPENEEILSYERGQKIVPENIEQNEGETPVRQYDIALLRTPWKRMSAEGRIQVTNKRMIFRATGRSNMGRTTLHHEFNLAEIAGVEVRRDWRFALLDFLFMAAICFFAFSILSITGLIYRESKIAGTISAFVFGFAGLLPFFLMKKRLFVKAVTCGASAGAFYGYGVTVAIPYIGFLMIIPLVLCIIVLITLSFKPNLVIMIKTKGAAGAIEICRNKGSLFGKSSTKDEYTGYSDVMPWKDTDIAIKELGAIINDIQTMGDLGIEKWRVNA